MKYPSGSSGGRDPWAPPSGSSGGRDPWAPPPGSGGGGSGSGEPAKKQQRTSSSSQADEASTSSSQPPPQQQQQLQPPPGTDGRDVPYLGEDLMFEVLRRAEARTLASAACVSRGWRALAQDERLWEAACVREWADLGFSEQQLRAVVLSLGGFRRLHAVSIRPIQRRRAGAAPAAAPGLGRGWRQQPPARLGRDQVQLSLSLFSIGFFQNMPNQPPPKKKDEGDGSDKGGGGQCG